MSQHSKLSDLDSLESWPAWGLHMDEVLIASGGQLSWRRLRNVLVARYCASQLRGALSDQSEHCIDDAFVTQLGLCALANVPEEYLSKDGEFVQLPKAKRLVDAETSMANEVATVDKPDAKRLKVESKVCKRVQDGAPNKNNDVATPEAKRLKVSREKQGTSEEDAADRLELVGDKAPPGITWRYPLKDDQWRCFAGHLPGALREDVADRFFELLRRSVDWIQTGPRRTAWMVRPPCTCAYGYGGFSVQPAHFPDWMEDLMSECMPLCGFHDRRTWPNSCNLNLYHDGFGSVGWHADDEKLFQGRYQDCLIISLSLGQARSFMLKCGSSEESLWLKSGDLCTMEGLTQKYYRHCVPKEYEAEMGPRVNLTWRWVVAHTHGCPSTIDGHH